MTLLLTITKPWRGDIFIKDMPETNSQGYIQIKSIVPTQERGNEIRFFFAQVIVDFLKLVIADLIRNLLKTLNEKKSYFRGFRVKLGMTLCHSAQSKNPLRHSARSAAEMQNLLNNRQNIYSSEPRRFCDCAQNDSVFFR